MRFVCAALLALGLAACGTNTVPQGEPTFYANLAQPGAKVDAAAAAGLKCARLGGSMAAPHRAEVEALLAAR